MECVQLMTRLASLIDRFERDFVVLAGFGGQALGR